VGSFEFTLTYDATRLAVQAGSVSLGDFLGSSGRSATAMSPQITVENEERIIQPLLPYREPLQEELRSFTDHVARGEDPEITGEDGYQALNSVRLPYRAQRQNRGSR